MPGGDGCGFRRTGARLNKDAAKTVIKEFNAELRFVRGDHPGASVNYVEHAGNNYGYHLSQRFHRRAGIGEAFSIKKLKTQKDHVQLEFISQRGARFTTRIYDRGPCRRRFSIMSCR
jgi:hypothetical protein